MNLPALRCALSLAFVLAGTTMAAIAAPTPEPGGANQVSGVSGTFSQVLFNGILRLRGMSLQNPGPADRIQPNAGDARALVFRAIVSNGTHHENHGYFDATLADVNGITVTGRPLDDGWSVEQGASARTTIGFSIPADFVPTKLVLREAAMPNAKAFRLTIRPSDIPAPP